MNEAATEVRERAADQSYRADAMTSIGERLLSTYHREKHRALLAFADELHQAAEQLAAVEGRGVHQLATHRSVA